MIHWYSMWLKKRDKMKCWISVGDYEMYKYYGWSLKMFGEHFIGCIHLKRKKDKKE